MPDQTGRTGRISLISRPHVAVFVVQQSGQGCPCLDLSYVAKLPESVSHYCVAPRVAVSASLMGLCSPGSEVGHHSTIRTLNRVLLKPRLCFPR